MRYIADTPLIVFQKKLDKVANVSKFCFDRSIPCFVLVKLEKLRFKAVVGLNNVFDIDIPVQNVQRHNALVAVRWQVG